MDKTKFKIDNRKETIFGIVALIFIFLGTILFFIGVYLQAFVPSASNELIGGLEFMSIMSTTIALVLSIAGEFQKYCYHTFCHLSLVWSSIMSVVHIVVVIRSIF